MQRGRRPCKSRFGIPAKAISIRFPAEHMAFIREMMKAQGVATLAAYVLGLIENEAKRKDYKL